MTRPKRWGAGVVRRVPADGARVRGEEPTGGPGARADGGGEPDRGASVRGPVALVGGLAALMVDQYDAASGVARVRLGDTVVDASVDPAVSPVVLEAAQRRGERVVAQRESGRWVVLGVLRTQPTPGVDAAEEYRIQAKRIAIAADHELSFASGRASLVLRAIGYVETIAEDITTRASGVHKLIGRMLRLN